MDPVVALRDALHGLGSAVDLEDGLDRLLRALLVVVPSAVGLEVLASAAGQDVRLGCFLPHVDPDDAVTSLRLTLRPRGETDARVVFYARRPGALTDLAADLARTERPDPGDVLLDGHRPTSTTSGVHGLERVAVVQRAVGVLVARGTDPTTAYGVLVAQARAVGVPLVEHAAALVAEAVREAGPPDAADG